MPIDPLDYLHLIDAIARNIRVPRCVELDDLKQAGYFGLRRAIELFDPERGILFATYATPRIRGAIKDYLRSIDPNSRNSRAKGRGLNTVSLNSVVSREGCHGNSENDKQYIEGLKSHDGPPGLTLEEEDDFNFVLRKLPEGNHRKVVRNYIGNEMLMKEVGASIGFSESRASQLWQQSVRMLRAALTPAHPAPDQKPLKAAGHSG